MRIVCELRARGRVVGGERRQRCMNISTAEASRLTRLINNVLDFSRMERGEKKYNFQKCDLVDLVRETVETYRPHLESNGFRIQATWPESAVMINGGRDARAQGGTNFVSTAGR